MRDILAVIGALAVGCTFVGILLLILGGMQESDDRRAREREQHDREQLDHIRRFAAVQNVLDFEAYRARKANAPATGSRPSLDASRGRLESQPDAGILTASAQGGQA